MDGERRVGGGETILHDGHNKDESVSGLKRPHDPNPTGPPADLHSPSASIPLKETQEALEEEEEEFREDLYRHYLRLVREINRVSQSFKEGKKWKCYNKKLHCHHHHNHLHHHSPSCPRFTSRCSDAALAAMQLASPTTQGYIPYLLLYIFVHQRHSRDQRARMEKKIVSLPKEWDVSVMYQKYGLKS